MCVRVHSLHGGVCEYIELVGDNCSQIGFGYNSFFSKNFSENMDFKLVQVQQKINQNMTPDVLLCILLNSFELF